MQVFVFVFVFVCVCVCVDEQILCRIKGFGVRMCSAMAVFVLSGMWTKWGSFEEYSESA